MTSGIQCGSNITQALKTSFQERNLGKREVWIRSATVVPKHNNGLITYCYVWII